MTETLCLLIINVILLVPARANLLRTNPVFYAAFTCSRNYANISFLGQIAHEWKMGNNFDTQNFQPVAGMLY